MAINSNIGNSGLNFVSSKVASNIDKILDSSQELEQTTKKIDELATEELELNSNQTLAEKIKSGFDEKMNEMIEMFGEDLSHELLSYGNIKNIETDSDGFSTISLENGIKIFVYNGDILSIKYGDKKLNDILSNDDIKNIKNIQENIMFDTVELENGVQIILDKNGDISRIKINGKIIDKEIFESIKQNNIPLNSIKECAKVDDTRYRIELNNDIIMGINTIDNSISYYTYGEYDLTNIFNNYSGLNLNDISNAVINGNYLSVVTSADVKYVFDMRSSLLSNIVMNGEIFRIDENGNIINGDGTNTFSIFDLNNINNEQYGGSQMDFRNHVEELLKDPNIMKIFQENFPNASYEDYELYCKKLCNVGCGYTAMVNSIFSAYEGKEQEFYDTFGFGMYTITPDGTIDYNYEPLILDWFTYYWHEYKDYENIEDIYGNIADVISGDAALTGEISTGATGTPLVDCYEVFSNWINDKYNINYEYTHVVDIDKNNLFNEKEFKEIINNNLQVVYDSYGYDLYYIDPNTGERGEIYSEDGGGHAMYVTGFTDNGDMIVSSWGKQYILDISTQNSGDYWIVGVHV